jgi:hypothetical protein
VCFEEHMSENNPGHVDDPYTFFAILFGTGVVEPLMWET